MRAFLATTSALAVAMTFAVTSASADCSGHKQVTASVAQKDTKVVMSTYDGKLPAPASEKIQGRTVVAAAPCADGEKDCKAGTE